MVYAMLSIGILGFIVWAQGCLHTCVQAQGGPRVWRHTCKKPRCLLGRLDAVKAACRLAEGKGTLVGLDLTRRGVEKDSTAIDNLSAGNFAIGGL